MTDYKLIGKDFTPPDITGKVTGRAKYAEDFRVDGMVFARMYTSPMAHGRVTNIDTSAAEAMSGVVAVVTGADCDKTFGVLPIAMNEYPLARDRVRYRGEPVAAVAAAGPPPSTATLILRSEERCERRCAGYRLAAASTTSTISTVMLSRPPPRFDDETRLSQASSIEAAWSR